MACFVVPAAEAIVTTVISKVESKREITEGKSISKYAPTAKDYKRLNYMLWGGSGLLAFEHLWHGEIQPFFPFLTAAANPADAAEMLHEMSTVGVAMAVLVTLIWGITVFVSKKIASKNEEIKATAEEEK